MRRKIYLVSLAILVAGVFAIEAGAYVCGDANSDGGVNVGDAVYLINYVFKGGPAPSPDCCVECPPTVTDIDGNVYQTVRIGNQCWMMENLKVTHYRNGEAIPNVTDNTAWNGLSSGAYCDYNNDPGNAATYGHLYNGHTVFDKRGLAPEGWHVPTDTEWKELEMFLGMSQADADGEGWRGTDEGDKLKEAGDAHWAVNTGGNNESGFTALPGGGRDAAGNFLGIALFARFWTSSGYSSYQIWNRDLRDGYSQVYRTYTLEEFGKSIRCVKD